MPQLITDEEKVIFKGKLASLMGDITDMKKRHTLRFPSVEIVSDDEQKETDGRLEKLSEMDRHREKVYAMESESRRVAEERLSVEAMQMIISEAQLYATVIQTDTEVF